MSRRSTLRASDSDRERVAERLRIAAAEGRLVPDELEERLGKALSAKTYGELEPLIGDLPAPPARRSSLPARVPAAAVVLALVALVTLLGIAGALVGHVHAGHPGAFAGGAPVVWLILVAVAWRMRLHRRDGSR